MMATYTFQFTQSVERTINFEVEADSFIEAIEEAIESEFDGDFENWDEVWSDEWISKVSMYRGEKLPLTMTAAMVWGRHDCPGLDADPQRARAKWGVAFSRTLRPGTRHAQSRSNLIQPSKPHKASPSPAA